MNSTNGQNLIVPQTDYANISGVHVQVNEIKEKNKNKKIKFSV